MPPFTLRLTLPSTAETQQFSRSKAAISAAILIFCSLLTSSAFWLGRRSFMTPSAPAHAQPQRAEMRLPTVQDEQAWINQNLFNVSTEKTSVQPGPHERDLVLANTTNFQVSAITPDIWKVSSTRESEDGDTGFLIRQSAECQVNFKGVRWSRSIITRTYEGSDTPFNPDANIYSLQPPEQGISCHHHTIQSGRAESQFDLPLLELYFNSERDAERALLAIIKHSNPEDGTTIEAEDAWLKNHLRLVSFHRSGVMRTDPELGDIYLTESATVQVHIVNADTLHVASQISTHGVQGESVSDSEVLRDCQIWPAKINWAIAKVDKYRGYVGETQAPTPYYVSVSAPKGAYCDEVWPDAHPATHQDGYNLLFLVFQDEATAQGFLRTMLQYNSYVGSL